MTTTNPPGSTRAGGTDGRMREDVHRTVEDARQGAAGRVDGIAASIDAAAAQLSQEDMSRLSGYVHDMAQSLTGFARDLRERNGDELLHDLGALARNNPALFVGGSVALGFGLSRFARAGRTQRDRRLPVPMDQARAHSTDTTEVQP